VRIVNTIIMLSSSSSAAGAPPPPPPVQPSGRASSGTEQVTQFPSPESLPLLVPGTSTLPHAGTGLFAGEDISKGSILVEYYGQILTLSEARQVRDRTYLKVVKFNRHINATGDDASIARFINDNIDRSAINAEFVKLSRAIDDQDEVATAAGSVVSTITTESTTTTTTKQTKRKTEDKIFIRALKDIPKGNELFVSYGRSHWLFGGVPAFLGLKVCEREGVVATAALEKSEVVCMYSTTFLLQSEGDSQGGLGPHFAFSAVESRVNCRLQRNPFIRDTTMVVATRPIDAGETLALPTHCRLVVKPSTLPNAGFGAFARVPICKGDAIGAYKGNVLTMAGFRTKLSRAPGAAGYAFQFNVRLDDADDDDEKTPPPADNDKDEEGDDSKTSGGGAMRQMVIDPTDKNGQVKPDREPAVCFINEHSNRREDPAHNCRFQFRGASGAKGAPGGGQDEWMVQVVATADVPQGQELFLHYGDHFHRDWECSGDKTDTNTNTNE
jgi:hypothetical protein